MTFYRCTIKGTYASARTWTTSYHINSTATGSTVVSQLATAWTTFWTTVTNGYENYVFTDVAVTAAIVYQLSATNRTTNVFTSTLALAGTAAGNSLPFQTAPLIYMTGAQDTKSDRGHMFLPTTDLASFTGDFLSPAFMSSMAIVVAGFFTSMKTLPGYSAFSWNRTVNKLGDPPYTQHILTNWQMSNKLATRRKRVRKVVATSTITGTM